MCADNSSSADVDLPAGARVIAARLYVETSLGRRRRPLRVALDGPADGFSYLPLSASRRSTAGVAGDRSCTRRPAASGPGAVLRQAVWDVTAYVAAAGAGTYTVADIVSQRVGPGCRYASWAIVVAYELDPAVGPSASTRTASRPGSCRGTTASSTSTAGTLDVPVRGLPAGGSPFGKSFHVVAGGRPGRSDNLLFAGRPLGNSSTPGDAPPPAGVRSAPTRRATP